jgi:hypothetical protein
MARQEAPPAQAAENINTFPDLITNVNHENIGKWTNEFMKTEFGEDNANAISAILSSVNDVDTSNPNANILNSFKDMQRRYVHVSLFASLSYIYITKILTTQQAIIKERITNNKVKIDELEAQLAVSQQSAVNVAALQQEIDTLTAQTEAFKTLESDLKERAEALSGFVSKYAEAVGVQGGGSKKKKRAQKGGFVRDGTRANLTGDPYPKAS